MNFSSLRPVRAAFVFLVVTTFFVASAGAVTPPKEGLRHGSRATAADGTLVVYDKVNGIFIVPDRKDTYWADDHFYQYEHGVWLTSDKVAGPWELAPQHVVPDPALDKYEMIKQPVTAKLPSGREAVYEPRLKVYKVAGRKGVFLFDGRFYRYEDGVWFESKTDDGAWTPTSMKILPIPLRKAVPVPEAGKEVTLTSGEKLVYDAEKKVFRVDGKPDTILFDGTFFERRDDKWFSAPGAAQGYQELAVTKVPPPVRNVFRKPGDPEKKKAEKGEKGARKQPGEKQAKKPGKKPGEQAGAKKGAKKAEKQAENKDGKKAGGHANKAQAEQEEPEEE